MFPLNDGPASPLSATAVVLSGGASRRMGRDKAFLTLDGRTLIRRVLDVMEPLFEEVLISGPDRPPYTGLGPPIITDRHEGKGPLAGLHAGLLSSRHDHVFLCACDMPFIRAPLIRFLFSLAHGVSAVVPRSLAGLEPLFAFYHRSALVGVEEMIARGSLSVHLLPTILETRIVELEEMSAWDADGVSFRNLNAPSDLQGLPDPPESLP